jgi:hypothetical protein
MNIFPITFLSPVVKTAASNIETRFVRKGGQSLPLFLSLSLKKKESPCEIRYLRGESVLVFGPPGASARSGLVWHQDVNVRLTLSKCIMLLDRVVETGYKK